MSEHRLVTAYLRRLKAATAEVRTERRRTLLDDVAAHLRDTVPANATDEHARRLLAEFGEPEALAAEAGSAPRALAQGRLRTRRLGWFASVAVLGVGIVVAVHAAHDGRGADTPAVAPNDRTGAATSVVALHPSGPDRTTVGRTYAEYAQESATLPALPPGAEYPEGVPKEPAPAEPVMAETGTGAVIADFTWLCAWETEYLTAKDANAYERVLIAERALNAWADFTPFPRESQDAWTVNVLAPVGFDDPSGVRADRPNACALGRHLQSGPVAAFTPGGSPCRPTAGAATAPSSWPSQSRR